MDARLAELRRRATSGGTEDALAYFRAAARAGTLSGTWIKFRQRPGAKKLAAHSRPKKAKRKDRIWWEIRRGNPYWVRSDARQATQYHWAVLPASLKVGNGAWGSQGEWMLHENLEELLDWLEPRFVAWLDPGEGREIAVQQREERNRKARLKKLRKLLARVDELERGLGGGPSADWWKLRREREQYEEEIEELERRAGARKGDAPGR